MNEQVNTTDRVYPRSEYCAEKLNDNHEQCDRAYCRCWCHQLAELRAQLAAERERADRAESAKTLLEADLVKRGLEKAQLLNDLAAADKADTEILDWLERRIDRLWRICRCKEGFEYSEIEDHFVFTGATMREAINAARAEKGEPRIPEPKRFNPKDHPYTVHQTYTGEGCAMCGLGPDVHEKGEHNVS